MFEEYFFIFLFKENQVCSLVNLSVFGSFLIFEVWVVDFCMKLSWCEASEIR